MLGGRTTCPPDDVSLWPERDSVLRRRHGAGPRRDQATTPHSVNGEGGGEGPHADRDPRFLFVQLALIGAEQLRAGERHGLHQIGAAAGSIERRERDAEKQRVGGDVHYLARQLETVE